MLRTLTLCVLLSAAAAVQAMDSSVPTVLITGANRGTGLELARQYAELNWNVIATSRHPLGDPEYAELQKIAALHPRLVTEQLDVTDSAMIKTLAKKYQHQPIDVLMNNAAATSPSFLTDVANARVPFERMDFDAARHDLDVDALGAMRVSQAFMPNVEQSQQKKVITMTSFMGSFGRAPAGAIAMNYGPSKAALNKYMVILSIAMKPKGVIVALVQPEFIASKDFEHMSAAGGAPVDQEIRKLIHIIATITMDSAGKITNFSTGRIDPF